MNKIAVQLTVKVILVLLLAYLLTHHDSGNIQYLYANF